MISVLFFLLLPVCIDFSFADAIVSIYFFFEISPSEQDGKAKDAPCWWRGTAPFCEGYCYDGEVVYQRAKTKLVIPETMMRKQTYRDPGDFARFVESFGKDCVSGRKNLCCDKSFFPKDQWKYLKIYKQSLPLFNVSEIAAAAERNDNVKAKTP